MRHILVVDDEAAILEALEDVLSQEGYAVSTAVNGDEGLRRMREATPDVLLLDLMMPVVDGHEMLRRIEHDPGLRDTPVILMSAGSVSASEQARAQGFLAKPFELSALLRTIDSALAPAQAGG